MFSTNSSTIALNYNSRCLSAIKASKEKHRFIVGTCSAQERNEISVIEYFEDSNQLDITSVHEHEDQVWALETSPEDEELFITSSLSSSGSKNVRLYKYNSENKNSQEVQPLIELASFKQRESSIFVNCIKWHHSKPQILMSDPTLLSIWSFSDSTTESIGSIDLLRKSKFNKNDFVPGSACWDPHAMTSCAVGVETDIRIIDSRNLDVTLSIHAHSRTIKDLDYNPNKSQTLISSGEDMLIKIWDLRSPKEPVKILNGHSHWVWCAKYNPFHDQLIASGGSDNNINLWRIASCSSAPWLGSENQKEETLDIEKEVTNEKDQNHDPPNIKVRSIDQHEDSIYSIAWSPADAWMYCSLSFDGRLFLNHVPSAEKYKILL